MENTVTTQHITITNEEFEKHWNKWKGFSYKNMHRLSLINQLDSQMQKELIQVARIAIMDAILSGKNNGKKGNDYNGLIRLYISGRQQSYIDEILPAVHIPVRWIYDEEYMNNHKGYLPKYYTDDYAHELPDNQYIDEVLEKHKIILQVLDKQPNINKEMYLHKFGLFGRKYLTYNQLWKEYEMPINQLEKIIRNLTQQIRDEYAKHIQSIT